MIWPLIAMGYVTNLVQRGTASLKRMHQIMMIEPAIADAPGIEPLPEVEGRIEALGSDNRPADVQHHNALVEFDSVTLVVRSEKVSGNLAGFVIDGRAKQAREKRVKHAVFSGLSPVPKFGNRNGGAKQDLFGLGQTLPSGQNSSISRA
jgi:ABC-type multidrug transport system fused ATPase/permease subunit